MYFINLTTTAFQGVPMSRNNSSAANYSELSIRNGSGFQFSYHDFTNAELWVMYVAYAIVTFLAISGNLLVMLVITTRPRFRTIPNFFIMNLAFADWLTGLFAIPFKFTTALMQHWVFPTFLCHLVPFMETTTLSVSVFTLLVISVDRFRLIINKYKKNISRQKAGLLLLGIWVVAIGCSLPYGQFHTVVIDTHRPNLSICIPVYKTAEWWNWYNVYLTIIQYFVPVIVVDIVYGYIAYKVWSTQPMDPLREAATFVKSKYKVVKMLLIVVTVFTFCWLPYEIYLVLAELRPEVNRYHYINVIFFCCHWLAMSNSCLNPIIYGVYNEKFQKEYKRTLLCICSACIPCISAPVNEAEQVTTNELPVPDTQNHGMQSTPLIDSKSPLDPKHKYTHMYIASELGRDSD